MTNKKAKSTVAMFLQQVGRKDLIEFEELTSDERESIDSDELDHMKDRMEYLKVRAVIIQDLMKLIS